MKSIFTIILLCCLSTAFAQTPRRQIQADDIYGKPQKSLVEIDQPKVNHNFSGNYLKKAGNSLTGAIFAGVLTGIWGSVMSKKNPQTAGYIIAGGGLLSTGLLVTTAVNLSKAGDELNKHIEGKQYNN